MDNEYLEALRVIRNRPSFVRQPDSEARIDYEVSRGLPWAGDDECPADVDYKRLVASERLQGTTIPW